MDNKPDMPIVEAERRWAEPIKHEKRKVVNIRAYHGTLYAPTKHKKLKRRTYD